MTGTDWRVAAASAVGSMHERYGDACQDRHVWEVVADADGVPVLVIVVSDGAGSAVFGARGAAHTSDRFLFHARVALAAASMASLQDDQVRAWVATLHAELVEHADGRPEDFAATLVAAVVGPTRAVLAHLGDGGIVTDAPDGWSCVSWPQHREFAGLCWFVTDADAADRVVVQVVEGPVSELALFTDGLERLVLQFEDHRAHGPFFDKLFAPVRALAAGSSPELDATLLRTLQSPAVRERTNDDATLVLASRGRAP